MHTIRNKSRSKVAIIVSGGSLVKMMTNDPLKLLFMEMCDMAQVVLACRVSPK
jgi:hypothetical protein